MTPEARAEYIVACLIEGGSIYPHDAAAFLADHDAHTRAKVLAEAKVETVAWLVKKAREQQTWVITELASKLDRGAVRIFLGTPHYRDAMDAHRAEVLAEAVALIETARAADEAMYRDEPAQINRRVGMRTAMALLRREYEPVPEPSRRPRVRRESAAGKCAREGESTQPAPDFFQPGHGYTHLDGTDFLCVAVTTHPNTGEARALGWRIYNGWHQPAALDPDDWTHNYDGCKPPREGGDA